MTRILSTWIAVSDVRVNILFQWLFLLASGNKKKPVSSIGSGQIDPEWKTRSKNLQYLWGTSLRLKFWCENLISWFLVNIHNWYIRLDNKSVTHIGWLYRELTGVWRLWKGPKREMGSKKRRRRMRVGDSECQISASFPRMASATPLAWYTRLLFVYFMCACVVSLCGSSDRCKKEKEKKRAKEREREKRRAGTVGKDMREEAREGKGRQRRRRVHEASMHRLGNSGRRHTQRKCTGVSTRHGCAPVLPTAPPFFSISIYFFALFFFNA